jgi:hypothetical protein
MMAGINECTMRTNNDSRLTRQSWPVALCFLTEVGTEKNKEEP